MTKLTMVYPTPAEGDKFAVIGLDARGGEYIHEGRFTLSGAQRLVARVQGANLTINPNLWDYRAPYGTGSWLDDGEEDRLIEDEKDAG